MSFQRATRESPLLADIRIIAVELTVDRPGYGREELAMWPCQLTLADIRGQNGQQQSWNPWNLNVTFHTSEGDRGFTMPIS